MAEYIPKEVAIENAIDQMRHSNSEKAMRERILNLEAADVRPVVRGKWEKELHPNVRYNQHKCSICGEFSGHDSEGWIWKPNFCPECGADMREVK